VLKQKAKDATKAAAAPKKATSVGLLKKAASSLLSAGGKGGGKGMTAAPTSLLGLKANRDAQTKPTEQDLDALMTEAGVIYKMIAAVHGDDTVMSKEELTTVYGKDDGLFEKLDANGDGEVTPTPPHCNALLTLTPPHWRSQWTNLSTFSVINMITRDREELFGSPVSVGP